MLKHFTKFVNLKSRSRLGQNSVNTVAIASMPVTVEPSAPLQIDILDLSWSAETKLQDEARIKTSLTNTSWFRSALNAYSLSEQNNCATSVEGSISFQGLTAASETAARLEALLCSPDVSVDAAQPLNDDPRCLNEIFWDLRLENQSLHRW